MKGRYVVQRPVITLIGPHGDTTQIRGGQQLPRWVDDTQTAELLRIGAVTTEGAGQ